MFATTMGLTLIFLLFSPRATARAAGIAGIEVTIEPNITESLLLLPTTLEPPSTLDPDAFWLEAVRHQGKAAFNPNPESYQVFRNVKVCTYVPPGSWWRFVGGCSQKEKKFDSISGLVETVLRTTLLQSSTTFFFFFLN